MTNRSFANDFLWGTATAGHQNEGDNVTSDTWFLETVTPTVFRERSGKACNAWQLWETDLDLVAGMGLTAFRFSIEWARIESERGVIDEAALAHYDAVIDGCVARGLAPIVTYNHFTSPHWFAKEGAWLNPASADWFASYCGLVTERFGDRIAYAITFNEPNLPRLLSWILPDFVMDLQRETLAAASVAAGVERYRASNVVQPEDFDAMEAGLTAAHLAGIAAIKAQRPDLPAGLSIAVVDDVVDGNDPGDAVVRDRKRTECYDHWLRLARADDFVGVQNYERIHYGPDGALPAPADAVLNEMGSAVDAGSLAGSVRYSWEVAQVPVLVTEHGVATRDDAVRVGVLAPALSGLRDAIDDGVPVLGYLHWTLMDNFEWISGYDSFLGLHSVDRDTFERTAKPSAGAYSKLVAQNSF